MIKVITDHLDRTAERLPDKPAFVDGGRVFTFAQTRERARQVASALICRGLFRQPVALYMDNSAECIIAMLGVAYSGNFYTVVDTKMPESRAVKILETLGPKAILAARGNEETVRPMIGDAELLFYEDTADQEVLEEEIRRVRDRLVSTDLLYILFTSGSTGVPKGVITPHRAVMEYIDAVTDVYALSEEERFGNQVPLHFVMSIVEVFCTLQNGSTMYMIPQEYFTMPAKLMHYIEDNRINMLYWVPSALIMIADLYAFSAADIRCVRKIAFGGEVMPVRQLNVWRKELPDCVFYNAYGATEVPEGTSYYLIDHDLEENETFPIGKPFVNVGVLILNEKDEPAAEGETGELCVYGPSVTYGYWRNPEQTAKAFVQNPLNHEYPETIYRTGDLVYTDLNGDMIYVGRKDLQIKLQGHRIELGEIEANVSSIPQIRENCCVFDARKKRIVLYYTGDISGRDLREKIRNLVPDYMVPNRLIKLEEMPHNLHGKLDRAALRQLQEGSR